MSMHLEELVNKRVSKGIPPGVIFGKVSRYEKNLFSYGVMSDGLDAPGPDTIFEIGSNTNVFIALLFARLEELGEVSLEDSIRRFLPASMTLPERNGEQISLLSLLTHTSVLPRMPNNFDDSNVASSF